MIPPSSLTRLAVITFAAASLWLSTTDMARAQGMSISNIEMREDSTSTYFINLFLQPTGSVTVTPTITPTGTDVTTSGPVTFTLADWRTTHTITVTAADNDTEGDTTVTITHTVSGGYSTTTMGIPLVVTVFDNDADTPPDFDTISIPPQFYSRGLDIPPLTLPAGRRGNLPITYTLTGALPNGLTIDTTTRTLTGTPTTLASTTTYTWTATDDDADTASITFTIEVNRTTVCGRSRPVRDAIVEMTGSAESCETVTMTHLNSITTLIVSWGLETSPPRIGDFDGLSQVQLLAMNNSRFTTLPAGVFDGLHSLRTLTMTGTSLTALPAGLFNGLDALNWVSMGSNRNLATLPAGLFNGLDNLERVTFENGGLNALPEGLFDGISGPLLSLALNGNPGVPFMLEIDVEQRGDGRARVRVREAAPLDIEVGWRVPGMAEATGTAIIPQGQRTSAEFGVPMTLPANIELHTPRFRPGAPVRDITLTGVELAIASGARPSVVFNPARLTMPENGTGIYTVGLNTAPAGDVTITPNVSPADSDVSLSPGALTFTTANWHRAQSITVTAASDPDNTDDTATITHVVSGYTGVIAADLTVTVTDTNDLRPDFGATTIPAQIYEARARIPTLTLPEATGGDGALAYRLIRRGLPAGLRYTGLTRTLSGIPTAAAPAVTLTWIAMDADTNQSLEDAAILTFTVTVIGALPGVTLPQDPITVSEGTSARYPVILATAPTGVVTVTPATDADGVTLSRPPVFSLANWNTPRFISVNTAFDADDMTDTVTITHTVTGYGDIRADDVTIIVTDIQTTPTFDGTTVADQTYAANVAIPTLTLPEATATAGDGLLRYALTGSIPAGLTFTAMARTLTGMPATVAPAVTLTYTATDSDINMAIDDAATLTFAVTITPMPGVTLTPPALTVDEGAETTYTVVLTTVPTGAVTVTPNAGTTGAVRVTGALTFSPTTWDMARTVTVTAINATDDTSGPATITHTVTGYGSVADGGSVTVTVTDPATRSTPSFGTALVADQTYSARAPITPLTLPAATDGDGTLSYTLTGPIPAGLSYDADERTLVGTPMAQAAAVTLTYTVRDTDIDTGPTDERSLTFAVTITVPVGGVTIDPTTLTVAEGGLTTYTAVLATVPTGDVTVTPTPATADLTTTGALTFRPANWNIARTVTVTAVDDTTAGNTTVTLTHTVSGYGTVTMAGRVVVTVLDDDADTDPDFGTASIAPQFYGRGTAIPPLTLPTARGGNGPLSYALTGALPDGLTVDTTRTLVGTPTAVASAMTYIWTATDRDADTASITFTIEVNMTTVCGRSQPVRDAIVAAIPSVETCEDVTMAHLSTIAVLSLSRAFGDSSPRIGDFDGLSRLENFALSNNRFTTLPAGIFDGLRSLQFLTMIETSLTALPAGLFSGLDALQWVSMRSNSDLETLPAGLFSGLDRLERVALHDSGLEELPEGLFDGISGPLGALSLNGNPGAPFTLEIDVEQRGDGRARVRVREAAPLDIEVGWMAPGVAEATGTAIIPQGQRTSAEFGVPTNMPANIQLDAPRYLPAASIRNVDYNGIALGIASGPRPGVVFNPARLTVPENGTGIYTVVLNTAPTGDVTITPSVSPADSDISNSPGALTFTAANWHRAQSVTVAAAADPDNTDDTATITYVVSGYNGVTAAALMVTVTDTHDSRPHFGTTTIPAQTYTARAPIPTLTLPEATGGDGALVYRLVRRGLPAGLGYTDLTRTLSGIPDAAVPAVTLTWIAMDADTNQSPEDAAILIFTVTVVEALPGVALAQTTITVSEGGSARYPVILATVPTGAVTVTPATDADGVTLSRPQIFSPANWNTPRFIRVETVFDADDMTETVIITHAVTGYGDITRADNVTIIVTDIQTTPTFDGATVADQTYGADVAITALTLPEATATAGDGLLRYALTGGIPAGLTYTATARTLVGTPTTVAPAVTLTYTVTDSDANMAPDDAATLIFAVTIIQLPGVTLRPTALTLEEDTTAIYTVVLDTMPTGAVTVTPSAGATGAVRVTGALTFSPTTWNMARTVTITALAATEGTTGPATITHTVTGYGSVTDGGSVTVTVPAPPSAPSFGTAMVADQTYSARASIPPLTLPDATGGDGERIYALIGPIPAGLYYDSNARALVGIPIAAAAAVTLTYIVVDTDTDTTPTDEDTLAFAVTITAPVEGVTIPRPNVIVGEGRVTTYTLVLTTVPTSDVTVIPTSASADLSVSGALTFSPANWNVPRTVTVTARDNSSEGDTTAIITHEVSGYGDGGDGGGGGDVPTVRQVAVTIVDDDADTTPNFDTISIAPQRYGLGTAIPTLTLPAALRGNAPLTYTLTGALPDGLTVDTSTRTLAGTPTALASATTYTWTATDRDADTGSIMFTIEVHMTSVCGRSRPVRDAIVEAISSVETCEDVTMAHLGEITTLFLSRALGVSPPRIGDFDGLSRLESLDLSNNRFTTLPAGIFDGLRSLQFLTMTGTSLNALPAGIFDGLDSLGWVLMGSSGNLRTLPAGLFRGLDRLGRVELEDSGLSVLPEGLFDGISGPLATFSLNGSPGAPFMLDIDLEQRGDGRARARVREAAPLDIEVSWMVPGMAGATGTTIIPQGQRTSAEFGVPMALPADIELHTPRYRLGASIQGINFRGLTLAIASAGRSGVVFNPARLTVPEDGTGIYTVGLNTAPAGDVIITPSVSPADGDVSYSPGALTFTTADWHRAQSVTVTAAADSDTTDDTATITYVVSGYSGVTAAALMVTVTDTHDRRPDFGATTIPSQTYTARAPIPVLTLPEATGGDGALVYRLVRRGLPAGMRYTDLTRTLSGIPNAAAPAVTLTWIAMDADTNQSPEDAAVLTFTVTVIGGIPGVTLARTTVTVTEGGAARYPVLMTTAPTGDVTVTPATDAVGVTLSDALTFSPADWRTTRFIDVNVAFDADDMTDTVIITHTVTGYGGITRAADVTIIVTDTQTAPAFGGAMVADQTYPVNAAIPTLTLPEATGGDDTLIYTLTGGIPAGLTFTANRLTLTGMPTTVTPAVTLTYTVTDSDDNTAPDDAATLTFAVTITAIPGVTLTPPALTVEDGAENTYTVVLDTMPTGAVTVTPSADSTGAVSVTGALTFSPTTWDMARTVTVTALAVTDGTATITHTVTGYGSVIDGGRVTVTVTAPATPSAPSFGTAMVADQTYSAGASIPTLTLPAATADDGTLSYALTGPIPDGLNFDADARTLAGIPATAAAAVTLTYIVMDTDTAPTDEGRLTFTVTITVPMAGVAIDQTTLTVAEGGMNTYTVVLATVPAGDVIVTPAAAADTDLTTSGALTFSPTTWNTPRPVTVTAAYDADMTHDTVIITHTVTGYGDVTAASVTVVVTDTQSAPSFTAAVSDLRYPAGASIPTLTLPAATAGDGTLSYALTGPIPDGLSFDADARALAGTPTTEAAAVTLTYIVTDMDTDTAANSESSLTFAVTITAPAPGAGVTIAQTALTVAEGSTTIYTVVLATVPAGDVIVTPAPATAALTTSGALTFRPATWNTTRTVTVTAAYDADMASDTVIITHTVTGYGGVTAASVTVVVTDRQSAPSFTAAVSDQRYPARLPIPTLTLPAATAGDGTLRYDLTGPIPAGLSFDADALTLGGVPATEAAAVTLTYIVMDMDTDPAANNEATLTFTVTITAQMDGVTITQTDLTVAEGSVTTYTVVLDSVPAGDVTVTPAPATADLITSGALTFRPANWDTIRTVTVTAAYDADRTRDTVIITHTVTGYGGVAAASVTVVVTDTQSAPSFTAAVSDQSYPARLPIPTLTLPAATAGDGTLRYALTGPIPDGLSFDADARTLAGIPAAEAAAVTLTYIVTDMDTDPAANNEDRRPFTVTITAPPDGVTIEQTALTVAEGSVTTYTVVLASVPTGDVTVTPAPATTDLTTSGALIFRPANWNTTRTVTVTAVYDADRTRDTVIITHTVTGYGGVAAASVTVVVTDTQSAPSFTAAVSDQRYSARARIPTLTLPAATAGDGTLRYDLTGPLPAGLSYDVDARTLAGIPTTEAAAVTLTYIVTDMDTDPAANNEGRLTFTVTITMPVDGVTIAQTTITVAEGALNTYTVVLATAPTGDVTVTPAPDPALTTSGALTFSPANWNVTRTVTVTAALDADVNTDTVVITHTISGYGDVDTAASLTVVVPDTQSAPSLPGISDKTYPVLAPIPTLTLPAAAAGDHPLTYALTGSIPAGLSYDADARTLSGTPTTVAPAVTLTYTVTDRDADTDVGTFAVTIIEDVSAGLSDLNRIVLPEVARALADQRVGAITRRIRQVWGSTTESARSLTIGGQSTLAGMVKAHGKTIASGNFDLKALLGGSDFVLPLDAGGVASVLSGVTLWGGGDYRSLSGKKDTLDWDGNLFSGHVGADARIGDDVLAGVAVSWGQADLDYSDLTDNRIGRRGDYDVSITTVHPYVGWTLLGGRLDLWATAGYGWGELEIASEDTEVVGRSASDLTMQTIGAGGSGKILDRSGTTVRLKAEALHTTMDVEGGDKIAALMVEARRARFGLEVAHTHVFAGGGQFTPSVEVGMRHDAGDGRTGTGAEVGGGLRYTDAAWGLTVESRGRLLLGHTGGYKDWGLGGSVKFESGGGGGRGLSLSLRPTWGSVASRVDQLWSQEASVVVPGSGGGRVLGRRSGRMDLDIGYGMGWGDEVLVTPYSRFTVASGSARTYRVGGRMDVGSGVALNVEGIREETVARLVNQGMRLRFGVGLSNGVRLAVEGMRQQNAAEALNHGVKLRIGWDF